MDINLLYGKARLYTYMNIFIQITISLAVLFLGLLVITILQKRIKLVPIMILSITFILMGISAYFGLTSSEQINDKDVFLLKFCKFIEYNNYDEAKELFDEMYHKSNNNNPELLLNKARLEGINGNRAVARFYYNRLIQDTKSEQYFGTKKYRKIKKEIGLFEALSKDNQSLKGSEIAVIEYLDSMDENPYDYFNQEKLDDYYELAEEALDLDELSSEQAYIEEVLDNIDDDIDDIYKLDEAFEDMGDILDLENCIDDYYNNEIVDFEQLNIKKVDNIEDALKKLKRYYKNEIGEEVDIENILVKCYLLSEKYKDAVDILVSELSLENIALLSELYIKGQIDRKDIDDVFDEITEEEYELVIDQYEKVVNRLDHSAESEEEETYIEHLENILDVMDNKKDNVQLAQMQDFIEEEIDNLDLERQSNYYVQTAKIDHFFEDIEGMKENIDNAIEMAPYAKDEQLAGGLTNLNEITKKEDGNVTDIPTYVEQVVDASLEIDVVIQEKPIEFNEDDEKEDEKPSFSQSMTNYISEKMVKVNINKIDISNYPEVTAYFQLGSQNQASYISEDVFEKEKISVFDTGMNIVDYRIEKVEYEEANFVLMFDMSGSMSEELQDLKDAGNRFIDEMGKDENVAIVGFADDIIMDSDFISRKNSSELRSLVDSINSDGGTNIYGSALYSLDKFSGNLDANNVLIAMTDGQDGNYTSWDEISQVIKSKCSELGVTAYTVGLGNDVDSDYLNMMAENGNGKFVYVYDANSLDEFYNFLHGQITNQYKITYTIDNKDVFERDLELDFTLIKGHDTKAYVIQSEKEDVESTTEDNNQPTNTNNPDSISLLANDQVAITGVSEKSIVKSRGKTYNNTLIGAGFTSLNEDDIKVELRGAIDLEMNDVKIIDDKHIAFTVPEKIIVGDYNVRLYTGKEKITLQDAFTMIPAGNVNKIVFGDYTIMANAITTIGQNAYVATGNVNINNMVRFKGDLAITGDYVNNDVIALKNNGSSYVTLDKSCNSYFAQFLSDKGINIPLGRLDEFHLYKDDRVENIYLNIPMILDSLSFEDPSIAIYPDYLDIEIMNFDYWFPFQDWLIAGGVLPKYVFETNSNMIISTDDIAFKGRFFIKSKTENAFGKMELFNTKIFKIDTFEVNIDTLNGSVSGKLGVSLRSFKDAVNVGKSNNSAFSLKLGVKEWKFDKIELRADIDVPVCQSPVPTTVSDFMLGVSNLSNRDSWNDFKKATFTGGCDINIGELEGIIPGINDLLGDTPSVLQVNDARASITVDNFALKFTGTVKLFEQLEMVDLEMVIGNYDYTEMVLNIDEEEAFGVKIGLASQFGLDFNRFANVEVGGSNKFYVNNLGMEIVSTGEIISKGLLVPDINANGKMFIAIKKNSAGRNLFYIYIKGTETKKNDTVGFMVVLNKHDFSIWNMGKFYEMTVY